MLIRKSFFPETVQPSPYSSISRRMSRTLVFGVVRIALLDHEGVLGHPGGVEEDRDLRMLEQ